MVCEEACPRTENLPASSSEEVVEGGVTTTEEEASVEVGAALATMCPEVVAVVDMDSEVSAICRK